MNDAEERVVLVDAEDRDVGTLDCSCEDIHDVATAEQQVGGGIAQCDVQCSTPDVD